MYTKGSYIFSKTTSAKNVSSRAEVHPKFFDQMVEALKGGWVKICPFLHTVDLKNVNLP
jgi:hypothetical protein